MYPIDRQPSFVRSCLGSGEMLVGLLLPCEYISMLNEDGRVSMVAEIVVVAILRAASVLLVVSSSVLADA